MNPAAVTFYTFVMPISIVQITLIIKYLKHKPLDLQHAHDQVVIDLCAFALTFVNYFSL